MFNKCPYHYYLSVAVSGAQSWIPVMYTNLSPCIPYIHSPTYSRAHLNSRTGLWGHLWNSPELLFQAHLKMDVFLSKLTGRVYKDGHILRVKRTCLLLSRYKKQCLIFVFFPEVFPIFGQMNCSKHHFYLVHLLVTSDFCCSLPLPELSYSCLHGVMFTLPACFPLLTVILKHIRSLLKGVLNCV